MSLDMDTQVFTVHIKVYYGLLYYLFSGVAASLSVTYYTVSASS